jgi:hypothetical protein
MRLNIPKDHVGARIALPHFHERKLELCYARDQSISRLSSSSSLQQSSRQGSSTLIPLLARRFSQTRSKQPQGRVSRRCRASTGGDARRSTGFGKKKQWDAGLAHLTAGVECCYAALLRWEKTQRSFTAHVCRHHRHRATIRHRATTRHRARIRHRGCSAPNGHRQSWEQNARHRRNSGPGVRRHRCSRRD